VQDYIAFVIVVWLAFMLYYVLREGKLAETGLVGRQVVFVTLSRKIVVLIGCVGSTLIIVDNDK
jgi:hypothetical protein